MKKAVIFLLAAALAGCAKAPEAAADPDDGIAVCDDGRATVPKYNGFVQEDYTATGLWLLETLKKHATR